MDASPIPSSLPALAPSSRYALTLARLRASQDRAATVTPEHLLMGVMLEPSRDALQALESAGADPTRLTTLRRWAVGDQSSYDTGHEPALPYTSASKAVIIEAGRESSYDAVDQALPRHLLRALAGVTGGSASGLILSLGVTVEALRARRAKD